MSGAEYMKFPKLKGRSNYSTWVGDVRSALILSDVWSVVNKDAQGNPTINKDGQVVSAPPVAPAVEKEMLKAWALINVAVDSSIRNKYSGIDNPHLVWKKLEEQFAASNETSRDQVFRGLASLDSSKYTNLGDYANQLKRYRQRMTELGAQMYPWQYVSFFRMGLEPKYGTLVFTMEQAAITAGTTLDIDKLMVALVEHDELKDLVKGKDDLAKAEIQNDKEEVRENMKGGKAAFKRLQEAVSQFSDEISSLQSQFSQSG